MKRGGRRIVIQNYTAEEEEEINFRRNHRKFRERENRQKCVEMEINSGR